MSLSLSAQPGFTDIADSTWDNGNAITAPNVKALNANAQFGAVRNEQFWGFYRDSETVATPVSPADGYAYSRAELRYTWSIFWTGSASGALNGTQATPSRGARSGGGTLLEVGFNVDQATGGVACTVDYFSGTQTNTHDGILMVTTHAQRDR
ncbi:MAG TPA: hypothetical protein VHZ25_17730 [Acidobacteriaceae bacterium]|jgi:hypothetical protein|nr:hypothetical protein [Acidobacteriaceae bacterium]